MSYEYMMGMPSCDDMMEFDDNDASVLVYGFPMSGDAQPAATEQNAAPEAEQPVAAASENGRAQEQIMMYQYLQAVEAAQTREEGALERVQELVSQPYAVQTLQTCAELDSGQRAPSFPTPEDQERYQRLCMAVQMAKETAAGKDPLRETLNDAMKVGAIFGAIGTVAVGLAAYGLYRKYKKFEEMMAEGAKQKDKK